MLEPSAATGVPIERQQLILAAIREKPLGSYVFSGAPGVGKTTLLKELEQCSRAALWKNHGVFSSGMREFQRNLTAQSRGEAVSGLVTAASLRRGPSISIRWSVFLDDFDKISGTEFARLELLDFINAAVTTGAQLSLSTNMNKAEFGKFFADTIAWRILKHCTWIEMTREPRNPAKAA
jgi:MoxR-like ATPase